MNLDNRDIIAAQEVLAYLRNRKLSGIANYSVVDEDYELVELENTACVADLARYRKEETPRLCVYFLPTLEGGERWGEISSERLRFIDYLVNRSFAKVCYVMPEHFNPTKNQCVVTRCDVPHGLFGFANNLLRIGIENREQLESWCRLVDGGVNEDLAFLMCEYIDSQVVNGVVSFDDLHEWYHSVMYNNSRTNFADILKGKNAITDTFGPDTFAKSLGYAVRERLSGGTPIMNLIKKDLHHITVKTEPKYDLVGDLVQRGVTTSGFLVNELNMFWEEY